MTTGERRKKAVDILKSRPDMKLNMGYWLNEGMYEAFYEARCEDFHCNTAGCAAGYLMLHPEMQAEGLLPSFKRDNFGDASAPTFKDRRGSVLIGFEALAEFFGLNSRQTLRVFGNAAYDCDYIIGASEVADRLEEEHGFIEKYGVAER